MVLIWYEILEFSGNHIQINVSCNQKLTLISGGKILSFVDLL